MKDIFVICATDVQKVAMKKIGRKLTEDELYKVKAGVEFGLDCWENVVIDVISELKIT